MYKMITNGAHMEIYSTNIHNNLTKESIDSIVHSVMGTIKNYVQNDGEYIIIIKYIFYVVNV